MPFRQTVAERDNQPDIVMFIENDAQGRLRVD
jgi:hypothetical protein